MAIMQAVIFIWLLVLEGFQAYEQKDGMILVLMQIAALVAAAVFQSKESIIFFLCSALVSMAKFFVIDVKNQH